MVSQDVLEQELRRIKRQINEAEARLGAHSVKPVLMQQLFELEEERDALLEKMKMQP